MPEHPDKHIRAAIAYALDHGWTVRRAGPRAHTWGRLYCGSVIEQVVRELYILHQETLKTMQKTSVELLIVALIACHSYRSEGLQPNGQI